MIRTASCNTVWKAPTWMRLVSITVGNLPVAVHDVATELAPTWDMVNIIKKGNVEPLRKLYGAEYVFCCSAEELYTRAYRDIILSKLDYRDILARYGDNICLVCFCKPGDFCHRHIVAEWLMESTGQVITEL